MFDRLLERAIAEGLDGVALVDRSGNAIANAGTLSDEIARPMVTLVLYRLKSEDLAPRLFAGEVVTVPLDDREAAVAIAKRQLFVVAVGGYRLQELVRELCTIVTKVLDDSDGVPWEGGAGGSGSGPAQLPVVEIGITLPRRRGKA